MQNASAGKGVRYLAVLFLLFIASISYGAVPQTINYQGYLTDGVGAPVDGIVSMVFALYGSAEGGSALWSETQSVAVSSGIYTVSLGSVTPINLAFDSQYYLGVTVGTDSEMIPRKPLSSTAYSFRSAEADSASNLSGSLSGDVSGTQSGTSVTKLRGYALSSTAPTANRFLRYDGSEWAPAQVTLNSADVTGVLGVANGGTGQASLTANKLLVGNGASGVLTPTELHWDSPNSRLGIGTATPNEQLEITGNLRLPATTATAGIIKQATNPLLHTSGGNNFFAGLNAGNLTTTGSENTGIGYYALYSNTNAASNTAVGSRALALQSYTHVGQWPSYNTAVGHYALNSNQPTAITNGINNTAVGASSLVSNGTGYNNTALGYHAGANQTTGSNNIYIGYNVTGVAGESNVTRIGNGQSQAYLAGTLNTTAIVSTGTVTAPTFSGDLSGNANNVTGIVAVANGGTGTSTGSITGPGALTFAAGGVNQNVTLTPSGTGYTLLNGNVGIGTTTPYLKLSIATAGAPSNDGISLGNTTDGHYLHIRPSMGNGANNPIVQSGDTGIIFTNTAVDTGAFVITPWSGTMKGLRMNSAGNIGIGNSNPARTLDIVTGSTVGMGGIKVVGGSSSNGDLATIEMIGKRSDANGSGVFAGTVALAGNSTAGATQTNKVLGRLIFGGNHTDGTTANILYPASIVGISESTFTNSTTMPTGLAFYTGSTGRGVSEGNVSVGIERMRIDNTGKVGIGTASPAEMLDVAGTVKATSFSGSGSGLTGIIGTQISGNISGNAENVTGVVAVANGGTGQSSLTASKVMVGNGTSGVLTPSNLHWDNTNSRLGVGTATPNEQLEITGNLRLPTTTATTGIIKSGGNRFIHNYGSALNFFAGAEAGNLTLSGNGNTGVGSQALSTLITGSNNTAVGFNAGVSLHLGSNNIYIGAGVYPIADESNTTRIGSGQTDTYIAGILHGNGSGLSNVTATSFSGILSVSNGGTGQSTLTADKLMVGNGTSGVLTPSNLHWDDTNSRLGIGTAAPNEQLEITGNLRLPATTATTGIVKAGSNTLMHTYGNNNFFAGVNAGNLTMTGNSNAATGFNALYSNTTGYKNTASGIFSLLGNTTGYLNTAIGAHSLYGNTIGSSNTAIGAHSLDSNTTAGKNTAIGEYALSTQSYNNSGFAWYSNNTAVGAEALNQNQPTSTSNGVNNTAIGYNSLYSNSTGYSNTATGANALWFNSTGYQNTAIGYYAGYNQTTGSNNTYIGYDVRGTAGESNVIRIGNGSTATYIDGIYDVSSSQGMPVLVNGDGQLHINSSSLRFKEDIQDMGNVTDGLMKLRPVTFYYKPEYANGPHLLQYGVIAEEVAEVYPDLVAYDKEGEAYAVYYQHINAMLLNEVQKQHKKIETLESRLSRLEALLGAGE